MSLEPLRERIGAINDLLTTVYLLVWDSRTMMPSGAAAARGRQIATLTRLARDLACDDDVMRRLEAAERDVAVAGAAEIDRAAVRQVRDAVDVHRRTPVELVERRARLQASAMQAWIDARARDDLRRSSRCWRRPRCWRGRRSASSRRRRRGRRRATCWPATLFDATRMNNLEAIDLGRNGDNNNAVTLTLAGVLSSTSGGTGISAGGDDIELFIFVDDQGETRDDDTLSGGWTVNGTVTTIAVIGSETTFNLYVASGIQVALR